MTDFTHLFDSTDLTRVGSIVNLGEDIYEHLVDFEGIDNLGDLRMAVCAAVDQSFLIDPEEREIYKRILWAAVQGAHDRRYDLLPTEGK